MARPKTRRGDIGAVTGFLRAVRHHRWATLPADAGLYPDDCPRPEQPTLSRAIPEFVMNQLEAPANLDRVGDPHIRLLIEILIGAGLRIGDATRLGIDCLVHDPGAATYLRYRNHKMRRAAIVPIDEQLAAKIADQQRCTRTEHPDTHVLLSHARQPDGRHPIGPNTFDMHLKQWLTAIAVADELGRPARVTPHQFRHTYASRLKQRRLPRGRAQAARPHQPDHDRPLRPPGRHHHPHSVGTRPQGRHPRPASRH